MDSRNVHHCEESRPRCRSIRLELEKKFEIDGALAAADSELGADRTANLSSKQLRLADREFWNDFKEVGEESWSKKFAKFYLINISKLTHIDLYGGLKVSKGGNGKSVEWLSWQEASSWALRLRNSRRKKSPMWANLIRGFKLYFTAKLIASCILQKNYIRYDSELSRFNATIIQHSLTGALPPGSSLTHTELLEEHLRGLQMHKEQAIRALKSIGAPLYLMKAVVIIKDIYIATIVSLPYFASQFALAYIFPFDFGFIRTILDPKEEQHRVINPIIKSQVEKFIQSSENFLGSRIGALSRMHLIGSSVPIAGASAAECETFQRRAHFRQCRRFRQEVRKLTTRHRLTTERLKRMTILGLLQPPNRNRHWLQTLSFMFALVICSVLVGGLALMFTAILLPTLGLVKDFVLQTEPKDILFLVEETNYMFFGFWCTNFYVSLLSINSFDQIKFVHELKRKVEEAIEANDLYLDELVRVRERLNDETPLSIRVAATEVQLQVGSFNSVQSLSATRPERGRAAHRNTVISTLSCSNHLSPDGNLLGSQEKAREVDHSRDSDKNIHLKVEGSPRRAVKFADNTMSSSLESKSGELNAKVVLILIHLKTFVAQLQATQPAMAAGFLLSSSLMLFLPFLGWLFMQYLTTLHQRMFLIYCSLIVILFGNLINVPNCYLYSRCVELYRKLTFLLAHIVDTIYNYENYDIWAAHRGQIYEEHTIWLLRKELNFPEKTLDKFATRAIFMLLTYSNFLRLHFWCGILIMAMLMADVNTTTSGTSINDSLGIF